MPSVQLVPPADLIPEIAVRHLNRSHNRLIAALLLAFTFGAGYAGISLFNHYHFGFERTPCFHSFHLDAWIPLSQGWVRIYLLYYPVCFLPLLIRDVRVNPAIFMRTALTYTSLAVSTDRKFSILTICDGIGTGYAKRRRI